MKNMNLHAAGAVQRAPTRHDGVMKSFLLCLNFLLVVSATGCASRSRIARPEPPALAVPGTVAWKVHAGETFVFEFPAGWEIQTPAGQDAGLHVVRLHSESGFYGQLTLLRTPPAAGAFAAQVVENLRKDEAGLQAEPYSAQLAGGNASGYRFSFQKEGVAWMGWVLSRPGESGEVCALGRWPVKATDLQTQWSVVAQNLRVSATTPAPAP
jgi:hypothetical protein